MTGLSLQKITKSYGETEVIHGVDLEINEGEFVVFVGPSGCGKSTLGRSLLRLQPVTSGEVIIDGQDIMACVTQGAVADRTRETLASSDC